MERKIIPRSSKGRNSRSRGDILRRFKDGGFAFGGFRFILALRRSIHEWWSREGIFLVIIYGLPRNYVIVGSDTLLQPLVVTPHHSSRQAVGPDSRIVGWEPFHSSEDCRPVTSSRTSKLGAKGDRMNHKEPVATRKIRKDTKRQDITIRTLDYSIPDHISLNTKSFPLLSIIWPDLSGDTFLSDKKRLVAAKSWFWRIYLDKNFLPLNQRHTPPVECMLVTWPSGYGASFRST